MILSAHQPHYLPWLPYLAKMIQADCFVLADDVQYKTHNFINRTRIKNSQGAQWLTVPVLTKGKTGQKIKDVKIANDKKWRRKHLKTIHVNYKYAPYFEKYIDFFDNLYQKHWDYLIDLNIATIEFFMESLNISCPIFLSSELELMTERTQRIVDMTKKLNCNKYISGPGGKKYMDYHLFDESGIELLFSEFTYPIYHQQFEGFLPNLSAVDLLFNEGQDARRIF